MPRRLRLAPALLACAALPVAALAGGGGPPAHVPAARAAQTPAPTTTTAAPTATTAAAPLGRPRTVATGLRVPWGLAFLPGGDALVAERTTGRIVRVNARGGRPRFVMRVPGVDTGAGEGGLLGLAVSPRYARDRLVYAYLTTRRDNRIVRFRLGGRPRPIVTGLDRASSHNGGRLAFGPDGMLYAGTGDAADPARAQDPRSLSGKILRLRPNGGAAPGNPGGRRWWSRGHRNVQGLAFDRRGRLWATEFGQNRLDEVNRILRGRNYGWPIVEGRGSTRGGRFTNPALTWTTSEASPSGAAIVGRTLYVAALRGRRLWEVPLHGARTGRPRARLAGRYGRLRTVAIASDGALWLATSNRDGRGDPARSDDRILRYPRR